MKIITTHSLTESHMLNINTLLDICYQKDHIEYSPYLGEEGCNDDIFILSYEQDILTGFLYFFAGDIPEVSVYVHPDYRRQGIATALFKKLRRKNCVLTGKDDNIGFTEFAAAMGYRNQYHEYLMEYNHSTSYSSDCICHMRSDDTFTLCKDNEEVADCHIYEEANTINIYDIYVEPEYRHQGLGKMLLSSVLCELSATGKRIILQVSERNIPAYRLYTSLGFKIVESVLFFNKK